MNRLPLVAMILGLTPALAAAGGGIEEARALLVPPDVPFSGEVRVLLQPELAQGSKWSREKVWFSPPGQYRRELLDSAGETRRILTSDGETQWVYERSERKAWKDESTGASQRRLAPEESLELLKDHYKITVSEGGSVAGRPTKMIEFVSRNKARLSRRLWVDTRYRVILRSQRFGPDGSVTSETHFIKFRRLSRRPSRLVRFKPPRGTTVVARMELDHSALAEARKASGLTPQTPSWLPSGYVFEGLRVLPYGGKKIIHFRFSNGTEVLSLFQCPRRVRLDFGNKAREKTRVGDKKAFLSWTGEGHVLGWTQGRSRLVLVGSTNLDVMRKVAESVL